MNASNLDWIMKGNNMVKILEGNYRNKPKVSKSNYEYNKSNDKASMDDLYSKLLRYNTRESITAAYALIELLQPEDKKHRWPRAARHSTRNNQSRGIPHGNRDYQEDGLLLQAL